MHRLKNVLIAALVSTGALVGTVAAVQASTLDSILAVGEAKNLADETRDLLSDYKTVVKQIDGLKVYNARLESQIENQMKRVASIDESISQVTVSVR
jgi:septal ring factor EnvC (AmiA/AmiB activator)